MNILTRPSRNVLKPTLLVSSVALAIALAGCNGGAGGAGGASGGGDTVATVNGTTIGRETLHQYLEATAGESGLRQLVNYELVLQEAKKNSLDVTDADVEKLLAERKKQSPAVAEQLAQIEKSGGPRLEALKRQIRYQLAVEKLITKDIKVDDAALTKWFNTNKANYSTPASVKISLLAASTKQRADTMVQQLKGKTKTFAQLIEEQQKANDPAAKQSGAGKDLPVKQLPPALQTEIGKLKPTETSGALTLAPGLFGVILLESKVDAKSPTLAEIRPQVERDYKLEQLARATVAKNPQNPGFDATVKRVEQMVMQQNMQQGNMSMPSKAEIYQFINQTEMQNLMTKLTGESKVEFNDTNYARLADEFKAAPAAAGAPGAPGAAGAPGAGAPPAASAPPADASGHGPNDGHNH